MSATLHGEVWPGATEAPARTRTASRPTPWIPVVVVLGGIAAGGSTFAVLSLRAGPAPIVHASLGDTHLAVPAAMLRDPAAATDGPQARIDLRLSWPDLGAVVPRLASTGQGWSATPDIPTDELQVTLSPAGDQPAPETRVARIYARFLEPQVLQGPGDLMTRRFKPNSPYAGEVLVFSAPDGRKAAARCESEAFRLDPELAPGAASAASVEIPATCIAELGRRGLAIQLRFAPRLAGSLEAVQRRLTALLDRIAD